MIQPKLYCLCGTTITDEEGDNVCNGQTHEKCGATRCPKCMWPHLRQCEPSLYLNLRTALQKREITEDFRLKRPRALQELMDREANGS